MAESGELYVAIPDDNKVLIFDPDASFAAPASQVLGQLQLTGTRPNAGEFPFASARTLSGVIDVEVGPEGRVLVADTNNNRVLLFPPESDTASRVLGQSDFKSTRPNQVKSQSINAAYGRHPQV